SRSSAKASDTLTAMAPLTTAEQRELTLLHRRLSREIEHDNVHWTTAGWATAGFHAPTPDLLLSGTVLLSGLQAGTLRGDPLPSIRDARRYAQLLAQSEGGGWAVVRTTLPVMPNPE